MLSLIAGALALVCVIIAVEFLIRVYHLRKATPKRLADLRRDLVDLGPSGDLLDVMVMHLGTKTFGGNPLFGLTGRRFRGSIRLGLRFPFLQNSRELPHFDSGVAPVALFRDRRSIPLLFREQRRLGPDTRAAWALAVMGDSRLHRRLVELHSAGEMSDREWREIERIVMGDQMGDDSPAPGEVRLSNLEKAAKQMYGSADSYSVLRMARFYGPVRGEHWEPMRQAREVVGDKLLGELEEVVSRFQRGRIDLTDSGVEIASPDLPANETGS